MPKQNLKWWIRINQEQKWGRKVSSEETTWAGTWTLAANPLLFVLILSQPLLRFPDYSPGPRKKCKPLWDATSMIRLLINWLWFPLGIPDLTRKALSWIWGLPEKREIEVWKGLWRRSQGRELRGAWKSSEWSLAKSQQEYRDFNPTTARTWILLATCGFERGHWMAEKKCTAPATPWFQSYDKLSRRPSFQTYGKPVSVVSSDQLCQLVK